MARDISEFNIHAQLAEAAGLLVADKFCATFGGREIYIPREPLPSNRIALAMGLETAKTICETLGPGRVIVPLAASSTARKRRASVMMLLRNGKSEPEIAAALGCHLRTVGRIKRQLRQEGRLV